MTHQEHRQPRPACLLGAVIALLALMLLAALPGVARSYEAYQHGGIDDCETCHVNAHTRWTPTSDYCLTCHSGFQLVRPGDVCWTCHAPGQDMSRTRADASCVSTCHLRGGVETAHATHAGGSAACTTCHSLTKSAAESAGSTHHTIPVPRLDLVSPAAAAPGTTVTLTGAKFSWAVLVRFGGAAAFFTVVSDTSIAATVPEGATTGRVTVMSGGGLATSAAEFVVLRPEPPQTATVTLVAGPGVFKLGRRVQLSGRLTPAGAAAQVRVVVQRRVAGVWRPAASSLRSVDAAGAYAWSFKPRSAGAFRARTSGAGAQSARMSFRVR